MTRVVARNRLDRAQRQARWTEAAEEGRRNLARPLEGYKNAKYLWLQYVADSDMQASTKLVAHTLALYGNAAGSNIFPGIRELERRSSLSGRGVATQIDLLVRAGWLMRQERQTGKAWTMGVVYVLCVPLGILDDENIKRLQPPQTSGVERASALGAEGTSTHGAERTSARAESPSARSARQAPKAAPKGLGAEPGSGGAEAGARGAEANAGGVEPASTEVLKEVQPISPSEYSIEYSKDPSIQCPLPRTGARDSAQDSEVEEKRYKIVTLLQAGIAAADIPKMLKARHVTEADVQTVQREMSQNRAAS